MSDAVDDLRIHRRRFLQYGASVVGSLVLVRLAPTATAEAADTATRRPPGSLAYQSVHDVYRTRWRWDRVVYSSHGRANCVSACSWSVFVKDGVVWREEQNAVYEA